MPPVPRPAPGNPALTPLFLAGPTAAGKSEVALLLAARLHGEIISVDSMQVYRGLNIGTAKANAVERARVPHHLLDVVELSEPFDAARFQGMARECVSQIQARGHLPILCGGTGLYFKAFLEGLGQAPSTNPGLRAELENIPLPELLRELAASDPASYEQIDRQNPRRVIRAIEVIRLTGKPFSQQRAVWTTAAGASPAPGGLKRCFLFTRELDDLSRRINARVDRMFTLGLVAETETLLRHGLEQNRTAMQAIGYRQVVEHLRGERSLADTIALVKQRTRQFAKRQRTWFKRHLPATLVPWEPDASAEQMADQVEALL